MHSTETFTTCTSLSTATTGVSRDERATRHASKRLLSAGRHGTSALSGGLGGIGSSGSSGSVGGGIGGSGSVGGGLGGSGSVWGSGTAGLGVSGG